MDMTRDGSGYVMDTVIVAHKTRQFLLEKIIFKMQQGEAPTKENITKWFQKDFHAPFEKDGALWVLNNGLIYDGDKLVEIIPTDSSAEDPYVAQTGQYWQNKK